MPHINSQGRFTQKSLRISLISGAVAIAGLAGMVLAINPPDPADGGVKEVENSKFAATGIVSSNAVFLRCGPGENYYPTMKMEKGAKLKVVGAKFDWLKVVPPEGSFCYVAKLYVDRHGDGKVGRVNKDSINVRAGSSLSALKIGILCELRQNEEVEIIGDEQEYFKIKPPATAYLYVNKKFLDPDPDAKPEVQTAKVEATKVEVAKTDVVKPEIAPAPGAADPASATGGVASADIAKTGVAPGTGTVPDVKPEAVTTAPAATGGASGNTTETAGTAPSTAAADSTKTDAVKTDAGTPAADPAKITTPAAAGNQTPASAKTPDPAATELPKTDSSPALNPEAAFDQAESDFLAARSQPLDQQPIDALLKQFEPLAKGTGLPESMRRVAESRLLTLKARSSAQADLLKLRVAQDSLKQKQMSLEAEQQELQKRIAENTVKVYTAVGTLQASSLQQGQGVLYRVTDPANGRTVCYLRSSDRNILDLLGQFIGVKGTLVDDARLGGKVILVSEIAAVDQSKLHQTLTAQIIPPSLLPRESTHAATDPQN